MADSSKIQPTIKPPSAEHWDAYAENYAMRLGKLVSGPYAMLLNAVEAEPGCRFVDVGTGPGVLAAEALRRGAEVVGVDFSEKMLEIARLNAPDADIQLGEATSLPTRWHWATAVVANFVLHLLADPVASILDSVRVMADGGMYAATVWQRHDDNPALGLFYKAAKQCGVDAPDSIQAGIPLWDHENFTRALNRARLHRSEVRTVEWTLHVKPEEWWAAVYEGGAVTGAFLRTVDAPTLEKVRGAFLGMMNRLPSEDDEVLLPARAMLGMGRVVR